MFRVATLGVIVRKQKISSFNIFQEHAIFIMRKLLNMCDRQGRSDRGVCVGGGVTPSPNNCK